MQDMSRNRFHKQAISNSLELSKEGIKIAQEAFRCKYSSQEALAGKLSEVYQCTVTRQPIGRFLKGQSISRQIFVWICEELDIDVNKVVKPLSEPESETTTIDYWQKVCRDMLEAQKQNLRRKVTLMGFELNVHVPLGLVERRHQSIRSGDFSLPPEQGSGFSQPTQEEIIKKYEHGDFLEQVVQQGQSKKSQGKRIAIIGEPGAGKTTLLEAIAFSPHTPGFPIWISLGSLGEKSLEEYLCQKWLKDALKTSDVTQQQKELEELFKSGEVLLLLDGVDEMPAPSPIEALAKIRDELTGWVADARVVLTCRINVWDASVNALQGFDTYRTLEFSYGDGNKPDQVREFICQWFSNTDKPELGEPLREKLDEDRHQRIRDLVKNPMRLSLLCQSWYFRKGDLPKTKAALYEQFTRAFYDWKEEHFPITPTKRINNDFKYLKNQFNLQQGGKEKQENLEQVNCYFIKKLTYLLTTSKDFAFCMQIVRKLEEIHRSSLLFVVVKCLKDFLEEKTTEDDYGCHWQSYEVLWHCAQNMPYPGFYQAWNGELPPFQALKNQLI
jgi:energy-coupling factor transporter ATP-binding protein EcfA2